jgi:hypothetical protein
MILNTDDFDVTQNYKVGAVLYYDMNTGLLTSIEHTNHRTNALVLSVPSANDPYLTFETSNGFLKLET